MARDETRRPPPFYLPDRSGPAEFVLKRFDDKRYLIEKQFSYVEPATGRTWIVPDTVGCFKTDLASVPAVATWLVPKDGRHTPAALLHDALVQTQKRPYIGDAIDRAEADRVFRIAMQHLGVAFLRRWMMWAAVSLATTAGPRPLQVSRLRPVWRVFRVLFVFGMVGAVAVFGFGVWSDIANDPSWNKAGTAAASTAVVTLAAALAVLPVRAVGEIAKAVGWSQRPQIRAVAFSIGALVVMTLWIPLVTASIGWLVYRVAEVLLAVALKAFRWVVKVGKDLLNLEPDSPLDVRLELLSGPVPTPPVLRLPKSASSS